MEKGFFDVFARYSPTQDKRDLLERATGARFRYTKEPMRVEVELNFSSHEDAELIYEIEDECREFYGAESFMICNPASAIVQYVTGIPTLAAVLPWQGAIALIVISTVLTLISGLIPAKSASRKDPVVALRSE